MNKNVLNLSKKLILNKIRYKDGDRLFPYDHVEIPEMTDDGYCELNIPESVRSDAGNYRCVAENQFGSARTACEVQVQRDKKPRDLEQELKVRKILFLNYFKFK